MGERGDTRVHNSDQRGGQKSRKQLILSQTGVSVLMCGCLLSACFLYLSHLETSDSLFECSSPLWLQAERGKMKGRDWASVFHCCASTVFLFCRTLLWWFKSVSFDKGSRSAHLYLHSLFSILLLASHPSVLKSLHSHTPGVNPQVCYPEHLIIWLRDMSRQAQDGTDCLSCSERLSDFGSTRVIPFYSWYEDK